MDTTWVCVSTQDVPQHERDRRNHVVFLEQGRTRTSTDPTGLAWSFEARRSCTVCPLRPPYDAVAFEHRICRTQTPGEIVVETTGASTDASAGTRSLLGIIGHLEHARYEWNQEPHDPILRERFATVFAVFVANLLLDASSVALGVPPVVKVRVADNGCGGYEVTAGVAARIDVPWNPVGAVAEGIGKLGVPPQDWQEIEDRAGDLTVQMGAGLTCTGDRRPEPDLILRPSLQTQEPAGLDL